MSATSTGPQCSRPGSSRWPGFRRKNVTVSAGVDRRAHHRAAVAVDAARQIDGDRPARRRALIASIIARAGPSTGRSRPAPNSASTMRPAPASAAGVAASTGPGQRRGRLRRIALEPVAIAQQQQPDRIAALGQDARADKAVAAVVARAGDDADHRRAARAPPRHRVGDRAAGVLHQPDAGRARRDRQAVGLGHFRGGEQLDHGACDSIGGGQAGQRRVP